MMKKIAVTIIIVFLIASAGTITALGAEPVSERDEQENVEEMPEADTEIIFDPDVVTNKTAAKSALADMHGVFVFRSAFITQEAIVKTREKENRETIINTVLSSKQPEMDYRKWVELVLAADTEKYIKDVYMEGEENTLFMWIYCIIISICIFCVAIRMEAILKQKKRDKQIREQLK